MIFKGGRISFSFIIRTFFLGVPILWLCIAGVMLLNLAWENAKGSWDDEDRFQRDVNGHQHGQSRTWNTKPDSLRHQNPGPQSFSQKHFDDDVKINKENLRQDVVKMQADSILPQWNKNLVNRRPDDRQPNDNVNIQGSRNQRPEIGGGHFKLQPEAVKGTGSVVVDISDLLHYKEIRELAAIFKPANNSKAAGEGGSRVDITKERLSPTELQKYEKGLKVNVFNQYASDMISVHRTVPDVRDHSCKSATYSNLPDTSVIICFHNEAMSTLLRTVHSVLAKSPPNLLKEIILVDDFSTQDHLKAPLDAYIKKLGKVTILRTTKREGLIRARLLGYEAATGTVLTFLDSHCECVDGWLEPLLAPIAEDWKSVTAPIIDSINDMTFSYGRSGSTLDSIPVGIFGWDMQFHWKKMPSRERSKHKSLLEPINTPTIAGGLFSIRKDFFTHLGTYDQGMEIWGGENLEISFKVWMCGGRLLILPCSRVGHIFRKTSPYNSIPGGNLFQRNSMRVAAVWMDEYKEYYFQRFNADIVNFGDVSERVELRKKLQCKSFDWYLKNVFPEMEIPSDSTAAGEVINVGGSVCLDFPDKASPGPIKIYGCHGKGGPQFWMLTGSKKINRDNKCLGVENDKVVVVYRLSSSNKWTWEYRKDMSIYSVELDKCMTLEEKTVVLRPCDKSKHQQWYWRRRTPKPGININQNAV